MHDRMEMDFELLLHLAFCNGSVLNVTKGIGKHKELTKNLPFEEGDSSANLHPVA